MMTQLTPPEREIIEELDKKGFKASEIAKEVAKRLDLKPRDPRTIKQYITGLSKSQSSEIEKQLKQLEHKKEIQALVSELNAILEFVSPLQLCITDTPVSEESTNRVGVSIQGDVIEWEVVGGKYLVKLDPRFDILIQHLRSSRRQVALQELQRWQELGGQCIKECKLLRGYIEKEVGEKTGLTQVLESIVERGIFDDFNRSIYWATFSETETRQASYRVTSKSDNLRLLSYHFYNLGWFRSDEIERMQDIHGRIVNVCQRLAIRKEISQVLEGMRAIEKSLKERLKRFCSYEVLPGKCEKCP